VPTLPGTVRQGRCAPHAVPVRRSIPDGLSPQGQTVGVTFCEVLA